MIKSYLGRLISGDASAYGYRKLTVSLRRKYQLIINKKKVYRLCKELSILMPQRERKNQIPKKIANNRVVTGPNQLWQMDIKYGYVVGERRHFFLASVIDVFDRSIISHYSGKSCNTQDVLKTLQKGLLQRNIHAGSQALIIRTDNGPQFTSKAFYEFCGVAGIEHERIPTKSPNKNAFIESFHSILERECYRRNQFRTYQEAFEEVERFIEFYNTKRIHGSLNDYSPKEYADRISRGLLTPKEIAL